MTKTIYSISIVLILIFCISKIGNAQDTYTGTFWVDDTYSTAKFTQAITSDVDAGLNIPMATKPGVHILNGYFTSSTNKRGPVFSDYFYKVLVAGGTTQYEYWIDAYSKQRKTFKLSKLTNALFYLDIPAALPTGYHTLYIRFRVNEGMWSSVTASTFIKNSLKNGSNACIYWFDDDYANKQNLPFTDPLNITGNVDVSALSQGGHTAHFRFQINGSMYSSTTSDTIAITGCDPGKADGFDYPIGDRGLDGDGNRYTINEQIFDKNGIPAECNTLFPNAPEANPDRRGSGVGWYNNNDIGHFYSTLGGIHPGEDWNYNNGKLDDENHSDDDIDEPVYAIANGEVIKVEKSGNVGYYIIIKHLLPDNNTIYSVYYHVVPEPEILNSTQPFSVSKGYLIAKIGQFKYPSHLHLEIRSNCIISANSDIYANDIDRTGYYSYNKVAQSSMNQSQIQQTFNLMALDGFNFDPSDFIEANRCICNTPVKYDNFCTSNIFVSNKSAEKTNVENKIQQSISISLSPNPTKNLLNISGLINVTNSFEIISSTGAIVKRWQNTIALQLNISNLAAGFYMLRVNGQQGVKFIKE